MHSLPSSFPPPPPWTEVSLDDWLDWRWQLRNALRTPTALPSPYRALLSEEDLRAVERYPFFVTPYYLSLAQPSPEDPILRQILPSALELVRQKDLSSDPFREQSLSPVPGLIHRYPDRVLLLVNSVCPVYCRHCFRKSFFADPDRETLDLEAAVRYVENNPSVREVILSGGDPLMLPTEQLEEILRRFRSIPHVEVLRIHTRVPVALPQRLLGADFPHSFRLAEPLWLHTHFNHPAEITQEAAAAIRQLVEAGIPVLNQSVLLRGVNADPDTLVQLFATLYRLRVRPVYLHHPDPVRGTGHFRLSLEEGRKIVRQLFGRLPGPAIPRYVVDIPGGYGKVPVDLGFTSGRTVTAPDGTRLVYPDASLQ